MKRLHSALVILTSKRYRRWYALAALMLTALLIIRFFVQHPAYILQLRDVSPTTILAVILLNIPAMCALTWAYYCMLLLCGKIMPFQENALLTAYSSIVNFFGPLQSGPGVRALYLKTRHSVRLRDYMLATLIYYGMFACYSALFLLVGMRPWWQTSLAILGAIFCSAIIIRWFVRRQRQKNAGLQQFRLRTAPLLGLAAATLLQVSCIATYYFVELRAVNPTIHLGQAISYAGAANFALFVSLTPGAIGFREAFLVFSQQIHHISVANILAANIIDRGSNVIFLALLFLGVLSVHAKDRLRISGLHRTTNKSEN